MTTSRSYAELFIAEGDHALAARDRAAELGCTPVSVATGAALSFLAATIRARSVVEVGTGTGVSGLHLFAGMADDGVLTSIDVEAEHQRAAKAGFADAGITASRARLINGRALDVLPRLTDAGYDLVFIDGPAQEYPQYVEEGARLLRSGGILVLDRALWSDRVADPTQRDGETVAVREAGRALRDDERFTTVLWPTADGLLAAVKK